MTTRWDSDVVNPYGWIEPVNASLVSLHPKPEQARQFIAHYKPTENDLLKMANKIGMAAWFTTTCNATSGSGSIVKQLIENGVSVDIYGGCGNMTYGDQFDNSTDDSGEKIRVFASENYKFYIAFENSLCLDFVTDK